MVAYARGKKSPKKKSGKADRKPKQKRDSDAGQTTHEREKKSEDMMRKKSADTEGKGHICSTSTHM